MSCCLLQTDKAKVQLKVVKGNKSFRYVPKERDLRGGGGGGGGLVYIAASLTRDSYLYLLFHHPFLPSHLWFRIAIYSRTIYCFMDQGADNLILHLSLCQEYGVCSPPELLPPGYVNVGSWHQSYKVSSIGHGFSPRSRCGRSAFVYFERSLKGVST